MPTKFWSDEPEDNTSIEALTEKQRIDIHGRKIGDWVVVLPEDEYYHNCEQGQAQQIIQIHHNRHENSKELLYLLRFKDGRFNSYRIVRNATEEEIEQAKETSLIPVTSLNKKIGLRVKPGPDWMKYKQSESAGCYHKDCKVGTIREFYNLVGGEDWVRVVWDNGFMQWYRTGNRVGTAPPGYDLAVHDVQPD